MIWVGCHPDQNVTWHRFYGFDRSRCRKGRTFFRLAGPNKYDVAIPLTRVSVEGSDAADERGQPSKETRSC